MYTKKRGKNICLKLLKQNYTTHTSFLKSFGNNGLNGLSIALDVSIALSAG